MFERVLPVIASVVITVALVLVLPADEEPSSETTADVVTAFIAAYERSRTAEMYVESVFTRTFNDGRELAYDRRLVQRPPDDALLVGAGSASGRLRGRVVRCNVGTGDEPECIQGEEAPPYDEQVAAEVANLQTLLAEAYDIERDDEGCFILTLEFRIANPPYGGATRFCFDEATGAVVYQEERSPTHTDVVEAVEVRPSVTEDDLRPETLGEPIATG